MEGRGGRFVVGVGAGERIRYSRCGCVCGGFALHAVFIFVNVVRLEVQDRMGNLEDSGLNFLLEVRLDENVLGRYDLPI